MAKDNGDNGFKDIQGKGANLSWNLKGKTLTITVPDVTDVQNLSQSGTTENVTRTNQIPLGDGRTVFQMSVMKYTQSKEERRAAKRA